MIDWPQLLTAHGIEYVDSGPSTAKGNIYVHCPWCGRADQSHHLGISLHGKGWGCWRNRQHRGKSARRLLSGLLGIGFVQAQALLDSGSKSLAGNDAILEKVKAMRGDNILEQRSDDEPLTFPSEFKLIENKAQGRLFVKYLTIRGYTTKQAVQLCFAYKLRYAMRGAFSYRLVIPIFGERGLLTWTGRTIAPDIEPRYKTLAVDAEKALDDDMPQAKALINECLFGERDLLRSMGRGLIVTEGPLDALRIDYVGRRLGVKGTCLFGKSIYDAQIDKLMKIAPYYGTKLLMLDADASMDVYHMIQYLGPCGFKIAKIPRPFKDPGEMPLAEIEQFIERKV